MSKIPNDCSHAAFGVFSQKGKMIAYMRDMTVLAYSEGLITVFNWNLTPIRTVFPRSTAWMLEVRERINQAIAEYS